MLSRQQVRHYQEQGYLALESLLPKPATESIRHAATRIVDAFDIDAHRTVFSTQDRDRGRDRYFMDSAEAVHCFLEERALDPAGKLLGPKHLAINKIGHAMHDLVPEFTAFCRQPVFAEILRDLGYRVPILWQTMYIFKQPRIGGEVRWHQDASYLITQPPCVTGIWVAIEDARRDNSCLWLHPGGHRSPLREIYRVDPATREGTLQPLDDTPWPGAADAVALEVPAGSVVLFHDHMPHYSSANQSRHSRHAFTMHVAEQDAEWPDCNWIQRPRLGDFRL
ncbi:MAG: phytanoyl-CoA dioxygenase family protein [Xanthomonadales bacterium]|nr:phytanoyl-CoA dioxygenase family protein [Xanthomonadales bacterium]NIP11464.1 phytanoyl-CoA dioxygenase family protein [Xanthomonadales bacterium]